MVIKPRIMEEYIHTKLEKNESMKTARPKSMGDTVAK